MNLHQTEKGSKDENRYKGRHELYATEKPSLVIVCGERMNKMNYLNKKADIGIVRIGVIGIGNIGSAHVRQLVEKKVQGAQLTAVCDINLNRLKWAEQVSEKKVKIFEDYHTMLNSGEVDAVIICTPHPTHPLIAIDSFQSGKHVLTEKPSGIDVKSVYQMNKAAAKSGKVFAIMLNQRTDPLYTKLRQMLRGRELGSIKRMVWVVTNWYRTQSYYDSGSWRATWRGEGGGVLMNQCPHNLDLWQWTLGMPSRLRAFCYQGKYHNIQVEDDAVIYAEYSDGASACFITSTGEYPGTNRLEISGTLGKAVIENSSLTVSRLQSDERKRCFEAEDMTLTDQVTIEKYIQEDSAEGHLLIIQNFVDAIRHGDELIAPGEEGIRELELSNAAYLSAWKEEWVTLPLGEEEYLKKLLEKQCTEEEKLPSGQEKAAPGIYQKRWDVNW